MVNEEIVGGLVSALSRGESLEKAMMTFYNAGYNKEEIEDSAKEVYRQLGPEAMGISGSLQDTLNEIAMKAGALKKPENPEDQQPNEDNYSDSLQLQKPSPKIMPELDNLNKENKAPQNVSAYGQLNYKNQYQNPEDITNKIEKAIKGLRPVNIPSRIEIVHRNIESRPPAVVQKVSDYPQNPPKSISKTMTYVLVGILILLLGALAAVFLFKDDLIKLFNNIGLG
jgi:hypothetical protein